MIDILLTVVPSICWILYRCFKLLQTPVETLVDELHIDIPHSPAICIDSITASSVVIHWDIELKNDESLFYILVVNNKEAATLTLTSCKMNQLVPNTCYQIQVVSINSATNFRSQLAPVYVTTLPAKNEPLINERNKVDTLAASTYRPAPVPELSTDDIHKIQSTDLLNDYLFHYQSELSKVTHDVDNFQCLMHEEHKRLLSILSSYKHDFHEESDSKLKKDIDVKDLEKRKQSLTYVKLKLNKQLDNVRSSKGIHELKINELRARVKKLTERKLHFEHHDAEVARIAAQVSSITADLEKVKKEIQKIDSEIRKLSAERKHLLLCIETLKPLINFYNYPVTAVEHASKSIHELISDGIITSAPQSALAMEETHSSLASLDSNHAVVEIFNKDGTLTSNGEELFALIFHICPDWRTEVEKELAALASAEASWRSAFKTEIRKYTHAHHILETLQDAPQDSDTSLGAHAERAATPALGSDDWYAHFGNVYGDEIDHLSQDIQFSQEINEPQYQPQSLPLVQPQSPQFQLANLHPTYSQDNTNTNMAQGLPSLHSQQPPAFGQNPAPVPKLGFPYDDAVYTSTLKSPSEEQFFSSPRLAQSSLSTNMWNDNVGDGSLANGSMFNAVEMTPQPLTASTRLNFGLNNALTPPAVHVDTHLPVGLNNMSLHGSMFGGLGSQVGANTSQLWNDSQLGSHTRNISVNLGNGFGQGASTNPAGPGIWSHSGPGLSTSPANINLMGNDLFASSYLSSVPLTSGSGLNLSLNSGFGSFNQLNLGTYGEEERRYAEEQGK